MAVTPSTRGRIILAGDIGGTNTNLALVVANGGDFDILIKRRYSTQDERSLIEPLGRFLDEARKELPGAVAELCCISAAGPVVDECIELTNAPWSIDGAAIRTTFGFPVRLINDFTAVSYGVILLDPSDPTQLSRLPHCDGSDPQPDRGTSIVMGAGTGLGVGYVTGSRGRRIAFPSEGGHVGQPCFDSLSRGFHGWMQDRLGYPPGIELGVSGQGIGNFFSYVMSSDMDPALIGKDYSVDRGDFGRDPSSLAKAIFEKPESERPALIAAAAGTDPRCTLVMELFVRSYARYASDLTALFLPTGGLFLAGGITSKNEGFFREKMRFMKSYELNYARHIREVLATTPVMIVRDYSISLIGAANAGVTLQEK
jgi:glucokinase